METKIELKNQACILVCCFGLVIAVDIAALVISQQDHTITNSDGEEVNCNEEGSVMAAETFAILAGSLGIALGFISMVLALCVWKVNDPSDTENVRKQGGWALLTSLVFLVISIIGFVNYGDMSEDCKKEPLGEVILAWCIIRIIGACCGCCQGGVAMKGGGM